MNVAAYFQQILIGLNEYCLVAALVEVTASMMAQVIVGGVGGVEALHEPAEICLRGFQQKMEVITHQGVAMHFHVKGF